MLSKLQNLRDEREQGFTLIELLVVILIIGILSAIAIPAFLHQRKSAVDSSVESDVSNAAKQVETWITKQGATITDLPDKATAATTVLNDIEVSDGTRLRFSGTSGAYCIRGTNKGGDVSNQEIDGTQPTQGFVYRSDKGGMQKGAGACQTADYPGGSKFSINADGFE